MLFHRGLRLAALAGWLAASGCTTLREIPRGEYAAIPERKAVRVETREGLVYEFDYATFDPDSLSGFRHRPDVEGPVDQVAMLRIPLDSVQRLTARGVDWYRTGLVGGGVIAGAIALGLTQGARASSSGGGGGGTCCRGPSPAFGVGH